MQASPDILHKCTWDISSNKSKITKIYVDEVYNTNEVLFLMSLSDSLNYLHINSLRGANIKSLIYQIIHGCNENLRSISIRIPTADDQLIEQLQETIDSNQWLVDYTIKRVMDNIYIHWK
jgi:predicted acetyltransferase